MNRAMQLKAKVKNMALKNHVPAPDVLAQEIAGDLESALEQIKGILDSLGKE